MRKMNFAVATSAPVTLPPEDAVLNKSQLAKFLGVCPRTVYRWHLTGEGPRRVKVGKQVFYRGTSIREWLESRESGSAPRKPVQRVPRPSAFAHRVSRTVNPRRARKAS